MPLRRTFPINACDKKALAKPAIAKHSSDGSRWSRRGEVVVVVVPIATWRQLAPERPNLKQWLRAGWGAPLTGGAVDLTGLDLARDLGERADAVLP